MDTLREILLIVVSGAHLEYDQESGTACWDRFGNAIEVWKADEVERVSTVWVSSSTTAKPEDFNFHASTTRRLYA
jgi:molybdopterin synthase catalytic subunit